MKDTETLLRATLRSVAADTQAEDRLHEVVADESRQRRPAGGLLVAAAVLVVVGVGLGATFLVSAGDDQGVGSAPGSAATSEIPAEALVPAAALPNGDPWPLPRLALDTDQLSATTDSAVEWVAAYSEFVPPDAELGAKVMPYLQVLRRGADSFEAPMIWIETNDHPSDYVGGGTGGTAEAESSAQFTIQGTTFYLLEDGDRRVLSADLTTGRSVYITGLGVDSSDLVDFAEQLVNADPAPGWTIGNSPSGMRVVFEGRLPGIYDEPGYASQMAKWEDVTATGKASGGVSLMVDSWGEAGFESSLYQTAGRVDDKNHVRSGTVRGHTAVIVFYEDATIAVWRETDDATASLHAPSNDNDIFNDILAAVIEVDEATWSAVEQATPADEYETTPPTSLASTGGTG